MMKMGKRRYAGLLIGAALCLTGCGNEMPDLTEEQLETVGEYTAQLLLSYDRNYQSRLVDVELLETQEISEAPQEEIPQEEIPQEEIPGEEIPGEEIPHEPPAPENPGMDPTEDTPVVNLAEGEGGSRGTVSLKEALGLQTSMSLSYTGYEILDSYPGDAATEEYFSVDAGADSKLLVLHFTLQNQGEGTETADTLHQKLVIKVSVNGISTYSLTTLLENDLSIYQEGLNPGESRETVILAEYDAQTLQDVASVEISVKNEDKNATIRLE